MFNWELLPTFRTCFIHFTIWEQIVVFVLKRLPYSLCPFYHFLVCVGYGAIVDFVTSL